MTTKSNSKFTKMEATQATIQAVLDGQLPLDDRVVLLTGLVRELWWDIRQMKNELRQEQQTNAVNTATLARVKALAEAIRLHIPEPIYMPEPYVPEDGGNNAAHSVGAAPRRTLKGAVPS